MARTRTPTPPRPCHSSQISHLTVTLTLPNPNPNPKPQPGTDNGPIPHPPPLSSPGFVSYVCAFAVSQISGHKNAREVQQHLRANPRPGQSLHTDQRGPHPEGVSPRAGLTGRRGSGGPPGQALPWPSASNACASGGRPRRLLVSNCAGPREAADGRKGRGRRCRSLGRPPRSRRLPEGVRVIPPPQQPALSPRPLAQG